MDAEAEDESDMASKRQEWRERNTGRASRQPQEHSHSSTVGSTQAGLRDHIAGWWRLQLSRESVNT